MPHIHVSHFVLTSFSDSLVKIVSEQVTSPLQPMLSTGSEHQGRTSISDPVQNLDLLVFFHEVCKKF